MGKGRPVEANGSVGYRSKTCRQVTALFVASPASGPAYSPIGRR